MSLPAAVEEVLAEPRSGLLDRAADEGRKVIGYLCSFVPEALLSVDGLVPQRLRAPGVVGTPMADTYLSSVLCSYVRSVLEMCLEDRYTHVEGWVFAASCDHSRRLCDNLEYLLRPRFVRILDAPHRRSDEAVAWYTEELRSLAQDLSDAFDVDTGDAAVAASVARLNEHIELLRRIGELRARERPPLSGADFLALVVASQCAPRELLAEELRALLARLESEVGAEPRARLLIVGSELDDPGWIRVVESLGAAVVADRHCFGSMPGLLPIPEAADPIRGLAEHALGTIRCPRMMEDFSLRAGEIIDAARAAEADGVIVETMKFCDLWGVESSPLVEELRAAGIPVLRLEREYAPGAEGQLRTRVQAFLESIE